MSGVRPVVPTALGGIYYVSNSGSDANPGTQSQPWKTIQKAANSLIAGQLVNVATGTYNERVQVSRSGAAGAPITFQANGTVVTQGFTITASYVTVDGFEITNTPNNDRNGVGIFVMGNNCTLENNTIHFTAREGIYVTAPLSNPTASQNCVIKNNKIYQAENAGITIQGRNHLVEGNEISDTFQYSPLWPNAPSYVDADGIRFFGSGHILRGNYIHDIKYGIPENINPHIDCFQTWQDSSSEAASNVVIEQNHCDNAQAQSATESGAGLTIRYAKNLLIRNNIINAFANLNISNSEEITIVNNTLLSDLNLDLQFFPEGISLANSTIHTTIKNNIFYDLPGQIIYAADAASEQSILSEKNIAYRSDDKPPQTSGTYDHSNDFWGVNPLLANPQAGDYHLQTNSPAIDSGSDLTNLVSNDYDGHHRPLGSGFDIGAYEHP